MAIERLAELFLLYPPGARQVRRGDQPRPLDELAEILGRALERHLVRRFCVHHAEHLAAYAERQVGAPLDVFGRARQCAADLTQRFERHRFASSQRASIIASRTRVDRARGEQASRVDETLALSTRSAQLADLGKLCVESRGPWIII
ncbi:MAG TPA: hypothetical protein VG222_13550 [Vicinamibacterales bacterium]|nr:hypothetical protein [Vicinamibacterales bacterium]